MPLFVNWRRKVGWQPPVLQEVAVQVGEGRVELLEVLEVIFEFVDFVPVDTFFLLVGLVVDVGFEELLVVYGFELMVDIVFDELLVVDDVVL